MNLPKTITKALVELCEKLYHEGTDGCTLTIGVPDTDMELEIEVSYRFNKDVEFSQDAED
jgi:hypothetical protein